MYEIHRHMKTQVAKCEESHQGKSGHLQRSAHNSSNVSVVSFFRQYDSASAIFCNDSPCASVVIAAKLIVLHPRLHPWHTCQLNPPGLSGSLQDPGGGGVLGVMFAGYVPLASQSPYPIIVYFFGKCNFRYPNLVTFYIFASTFSMWFQAGRM